MLVMVKEFTGVAVESFRTGDLVGNIADLIINPAGLKVAAFYIKPLRSHDLKILVVDDVREIDGQGIIIDDEEKLMDMDDLIRISEIAKINYQIVGKKVETDKGRKVGKVNDYAVDDQTWGVKKLYVSKGVIKDFTSLGKMIDRNQILKVTDKKIIVKDVDIKVSDKGWAVSAPSAQDIATTTFSKK